MTRSIRPLVAVLVGVAFTVAACGDDDPGQPDPAAGGAESAAETSTEAQPIAPADDMTEGTPDTTPPAPTVPAIEPTGVVIPVIALDNSFRPQVIEISVGDEVLWENRGINEHNALSVVGDDWGVEVEQFQPGDIYTHVFTEPGEYDYFCSIHGNETIGMVGKVIVSE